MYQGRFALAGAAFLFWIYINLFVWLAVPFANFGYRWLDDAQLRVWGIEPATLYAGQLAEDDVIVAINGVRPSPRGPVYPLPRAQVYTLTIQHETTTSVVEINYPPRPGPVALDYRLPAGLLSGLLWVVGCLLFYLADAANWMAVRVGYILTLTGVAVIGVQGFILGVPGAWVSSTLLIPVAISFVYVGFLPRNRPLPRFVRNVLWAGWASGGLLVLLTIIGGLEVLPSPPWYWRFVIELYRHGMGAISVGAITLCLLQVERFRRTPPSYERRQLLILMTFMGLGAVPAGLLAFLPRLVFDVAIIPLPVAITLLILCPLGYFYVIFRHDYLNLDLLFSRFASLILVTGMMLVVYGVLFFTVQRELQLQGGLLAHFVVLAPVFILSGYLGRPVNSIVNRLFFGAQLADSQERLPTIASNLSAKPEAATLQEIIGGLSQDFNIPQVLLAMKNGQGMLMAIAYVNVSADVGHGSLPGLDKTLLRGQAGEHPLFVLHSWAELLVPVRLKDRLLGYLALARPKGDRFNAQHLMFFNRLADILAIGVEAVLLFETTHRRPLEVLRSQEFERSRLASQIHNGPLQALTFIIYTLQETHENVSRLAPEPALRLREGIKDIQEAIYDLRQICIGLYPLALGQGVEFIVEDLAAHFQQTHGLNVILDIRLPLGFDTDSEIANAVYHILQESLNNVVKHAGTNGVKISVWVEVNSLWMVVADEGKGACVAGLSLSDLSRQKYFGVHGMAIWAEMVGGYLSVESNQPSGTRVVLRLPMRE